MTRKEAQTIADIIIRLVRTGIDMKEIASLTGMRIGQIEKQFQSETHVSAETIADLLLDYEHSPAAEIDPLKETEFSNSFGDIPGIHYNDKN